MSLIASNATKMHFYGNPKKTSTSSNVQSIDRICVTNLFSSNALSILVQSQKLVCWQYCITPSSVKSNCKVFTSHLTARLLSREKETQSLFFCTFSVHLPFICYVLIIKIIALHIGVFLHILNLVCICKQNL